MILILQYTKYSNTPKIYHNVRQIYEFETPSIVSPLGTYELHHTAILSRDTNAITSDRQRFYRLLNLHERRSCVLLSLIFFIDMSFIPLPTYSVAYNTQRLLYSSPVRTDNHYLLNYVCHFDMWSMLYDDMQKWQVYQRGPYRN